MVVASGGVEPSDRVCEIADAPVSFKSDDKGEKVTDRPKTICRHRYFSSHMVTFKVNTVK